jgi:transposase-like protein
MKKPLAGKRRANDKFTVEQIIFALRSSGGIYASAARRLGCSVNTVKSYVARYSEVASALREILEARIDIAETVLLAAMSNQSNPSASLNAALFYLRMKGHSRGYGLSRPKKPPSLPTPGQGTSKTFLK